MWFLETWTVSSQPVVCHTLSPVYSMPPLSKGTPIFWHQANLTHVFCVLTANGGQTDDEDTSLQWWLSESFFLFFCFWKILSTAVSCLQVELYFPFQKKGGRWTHESDTSFMYSCMNVKKKAKKIPCEGAEQEVWVDIPWLNESWKITQAQTSDTLNHRSHTLQSPHSPAKSISHKHQREIILLFCLAAVCPICVRLKDLQTISSPALGGEWVRVTEVFFLLLFFQKNS